MFDTGVVVAAAELRDLVQPTSLAAERILLGSFSAHLARHAPCSVLLARPAAGEEHEGRRTARAQQEVV